MPDRLHDGQSRAGRRGNRVIVEWQPIDLLDIEDGVGAQESDILARLLARHPVGFGLREAGKIDAVRAGLPTADLATEFLCLSVGHPGPRRIAARVTDRPEVEVVDAGIGRAAMAERPTAGTGQAPWARPWQNARCELFDDEVRDLGGDVAAWLVGKFATEGHLWSSL